MENNIITKWEKLGLLSGIPEDNKKYLSDLYEVCIGDLKINDDIREIFGTTNRDNESDATVSDVTNFWILPLLKQCYLNDTTITYPEFKNGVLNVNFVINYLYPGLDEHEYVNPFNDWARRITEYIKENR